MIWTFPVPPGTGQGAALLRRPQLPAVRTSVSASFNISINGTAVDPNFDIVGTVGYNTAGDA